MLRILFCEILLTCCCSLIPVETLRNEGVWLESFSKNMVWVIFGRRFRYAVFYQWEQKHLWHFTSYRRQRTVVKLTFYYKDGCWLCDTAEEMLNGFAEKYILRVEKINIASSDDLYELYRFDIPVFEFKDGSTLHGRIKKKDLIERFKANKE